MYVCMCVLEFACNIFVRALLIVDYIWRNCISLRWRTWLIKLVHKI